MRRLSSVVIAVLLAACPPGGNVNGTLRAHQVTLFEGAIWQDERCTEGAGAENCCIRNGPFCPDFTDYLITDVRTQGTRVVVLLQANNGNLVVLSDDSGATWKTLAVGSVGNIAELQKMGLHLAGDAVFLMVQSEEPISNETRIVLRPFRVDLETGGTTREGDILLITRPHAYSASDGTASGAMLYPQDARNPFSPCMAMVERWTPGRPVERVSAVTGLGTCGIQYVTASNGPRFFSGVLAESGEGGRSCAYSIDGNDASVGFTCGQWALWPAARDSTLPRRFAAYAGERALALGVFEADGAAWASEPASRDWIFLGAGVPGRNRSLSDNQPYAGLMPIGDDSGGKLVRINRDATVDEVVLPLSPCVEPGKSCMDPKNAQTFHGEVGDLEWAHPLGDDEYLLFYVHDVAPGINQYKPVFTVSKERATYRRVTPREKPAALGPPGAPNAKPATSLELLCLKQAACQGVNQNLFDCVGRYLTQHELIHTAYETTMAQALSADCSSLLLRGSGGLDCALRGGSPVERDGGAGSLYVDCDFGVPSLPTACGTCVGNIARDCSGLGGVSQWPVNCAAAGATCSGGRCVSPSACSGDGTSTCSGDRGERCWSGARASVRCDLLSLQCNPASMAVAFRPCTFTGMLNTAPYCAGAYLLWDLSGEKWADCAQLGFSGCKAGRCTR
jgi:hypothetical protein